MHTGICQENTVGLPVSVAIMSHENCGLHGSTMNPCQKTFAGKIDISDQSEESLHQRKGNTNSIDLVMSQYVCYTLSTELFEQQDICQPDTLKNFEVNITF